MGTKFQHWLPRKKAPPKNLEELRNTIWQNRSFAPLEKLHFGDHGIVAIAEILRDAIQANKRIALYADYDVDGTMSCVSWIWFFQAIGFTNYLPYIPCRFSEGYGVNLQAVEKLIDQEGAEVILTMDTGITANQEAALCKARGVTFICTDHHIVQKDMMPDCHILNPKFHPENEYQELCGCGITFVLLRKMAEFFPLPASLWTDLLALAGMATICDIVPLNPVNHRLARLGIQALCKSERPILRLLRETCQVHKQIDEHDVGFRLGPRINAVGRLGHANAVIDAFIRERPEELIAHMGEVNEQRKGLQAKILKEAHALAEEYRESPLLFLGGDWHPGVVGIAASKLAEEFWRPVWLFQRGEEQCKGSARSIPGFDVTGAMLSAKGLFSKCGGHAAAGGFTFSPKQETAIREALTAHAEALRAEQSSLWESSIHYDCPLPLSLASLTTCEALDALKPFGNGFEEPTFHLKAEIVRTTYYRDKQTGEARHTAVSIRNHLGSAQKLLFFHQVLPELSKAKEAEFICSLTKNFYRGVPSLTLVGQDFRSCSL